MDDEQGRPPPATDGFVVLVLSIRESSDDPSTKSICAQMISLAISPRMNVRLG
jgi:hypothetical protein